MCALIFFFSPLFLNILFFPWLDCNASCSRIFTYYYIAKFHLIIVQS
ncbi:hypothetical protein WN943_000513 [Citrus x changshan-huyou]